MMSKRQLNTQGMTQSCREASSCARLWNNYTGAVVHSHGPKLTQADMVTDSDGRILHENIRNNKKAQVWGWSYVHASVFAKTRQRDKPLMRKRYELRYYRKAGNLDASKEKWTRETPGT